MSYNNYYFTLACGNILGPKIIAVSLGFQNNSSFFGHKMYTFMRFLALFVLTDSLFDISTHLAYRVNAKEV